MSSVSPKRTFKTHKTQETTATVVKTPSERMTQNANSANFQNASFAKRSFAKRGSEFQNAVLNTLSKIYRLFNVSQPPTPNATGYVTY